MGGDETLFHACAPDKMTTFQTTPNLHLAVVATERSGWPTATRQWAEPSAPATKGCQSGRPQRQCVARGRVEARPREF
jgi:hypothetical protein